MKLTPAEKRTVELVQKGIGNSVLGACVLVLMCTFVNTYLYTHVFHLPDLGEKPVVMMRESDLRDIIRQEIRK